ncbi:hypothetical protein FACS1894201_06890 [Bacteroidia bacterium]|nr:hypothetical protein FACS1894201_06890 [Bacteroidia bacterium]
MKKISFLLVCLWLLFSGFAQQIIKTNSAIVYTSVNNNEKREWRLTDKTTLDVFDVFLPYPQINTVTFSTDLMHSVTYNDIKPDTLYTFKISFKDTLYPIGVIIRSKVPSTVSAVDRMADLSLLWSEMRYNFAFYDELDFDFDSLYRAYIQAVMHAQNDYEYYTLLAKFMASVKDGHTELVATPIDRFTDYVPLILRSFMGDLYVTSIRIPLDKIMPVGSKILKIQDIPVSKYISEKALPFVNSKGYVLQ